MLSVVGGGRDLGDEQMLLNMSRGSKVKVRGCRKGNVLATPTVSGERERERRKDGPRTPPERGLGSDVGGSC